MKISSPSSNAKVSAASDAHVKTRHINALRNNLKKVVNGAEGKFTSAIIQEIKEFGKQADKFKSSIAGNKGAYKGGGEVKIATPKNVLDGVKHLARLENNFTSQPASEGSMFDKDWGESPRFQ